MKIGRTTAWLMLACLACVDRIAPTDEFPPTPQEFCVEYCEHVDKCWHEEELPNPFADDIPGCVADCRSLDAAWADDPMQRYHCADLIHEMRLCYVSYENCEAIDDAQIDGRWGPDARCAQEVRAVSQNHCSIPDPRDDP
jgi:hypothetical protein